MSAAPPPSPPRANPFGDLDDFAAQGAPKPVPAAAIEEIARHSGFPSRKARAEPAEAPASEPAKAPAPPARVQRRRTTGRNRQINIKATEETIAELYRIADDLDLPLGAVLERALEALKGTVVSEG
ncbi:stability/partitioning determinant [Novosphingobium sp. 18050]|uniref:stability/partitioning determinant n=1 Tax=Novosphingobium sp. 18050 TaxID=2681398 RepID=UPI0013588A08|nr:stability/partitioning determinant [Novosphingobium sp. 18050]